MRVVLLAGGDHSLVGAVSVNLPLEGHSSRLAPRVALVRLHPLEGVVRLRTLQVNSLFRRFFLALLLGVVLGLELVVGVVSLLQGRDGLVGLLQVSLVENLRFYVTSILPPSGVHS